MLTAFRILSNLKTTSEQQSSKACRDFRYHKMSASATPAASGESEDVEASDFHWRPQVSCPNQARRACTNQRPASWQRYARDLKLLWAGPQHGAGTSCHVLSSHDLAQANVCNSGIVVCILQSKAQTYISLISVVRVYICKVKYQQEKGVNAHIAVPSQLQDSADCPRGPPCSETVNGARNRWGASYASMQCCRQIAIEAFET